ARDRNGRSLADTLLTDPSPHKFGHSDAFQHLAQWARQEYGQRMRLIAVGHRVVHGGIDFLQPVLVDESVLAKLEKLIPLVPLHQPHNLAGIREVMKLRPD